jgi:predicted negative regulator of RcsB-dependent stress response
MDRDRLKDIQTADISESNVNEDFVYWLKTKGPSYLLIVMIVIVAYLFFVRYQQSKMAHRAEAWIAYIEASATGLPASHEDVAQTYSDIDAIQELGLLTAGDAYLKAVVLNQTIGSSADISTALSDEDRTFYLEKADNLYSRVVANDDKSDSAALFVVSGLNGRAAIAESRGDVEAAKKFYESAAARIENLYPALATQALARASTIDTLANEIILPTDADVSARNNQVLSRDPKPVNSTIDILTEITKPEDQ